MSNKITGKITEIFTSIQGEGLYFGEEHIFVRFFGCNLKCSFCDTPLEHFAEYEPEGLLQELKQRRNGGSTVSFTGGEPLLQNNFLKEASRLTKIAGYKNYLETNGILHEALGEIIEYIDIVAMDIKLPSSTGLEGFWDQHRRFLEVASRKETFIKAVICRATKEEDLKEGVKMIHEVNASSVLVLQPNSFEESELLREKIERFKEIAINDHVTACIIPQMHKKIGLK